MALLVAGCIPEEATLFTKLSTDATGIDFVNENIETERSNIFTYEYFYNGGGVAVGDINNDGLTDIYFTANIFSNKLYLNQGNFRFKDITETSGTACEAGWKTGVTMVDVNADGLLDIYICQSASPDPERRRNILFINNGDLTFTDRAHEFGLDDDSFSTHAAYFDFDRDHDLDVILLNHSLLSISNSFDISSRDARERYPFVGNKLLQNDDGKFTDVSDSLGVFGPASNYGLGISLSDINNDGWIDIYSGCDYTGKDKLLLNQQGRYFLDATDSLLTHISKFTMGTDIADFNGDGLMDIYTLDMLPEDNRRQKQLMGADNYEAYTAMVRNGLHSQYMRNMLHLNNGNGTFSEIGQLAGVSNSDWSWAPLFADFDNDGILDLFVSNGFKRDLTDNDFTKYKAFQEIVDARRQGKMVSFIEVMSKFNENEIPNYIYRGNGDLTFSNKVEDWGFEASTLTNGVAYSDLDNDGDLDLVLNNINEKAGIYKNNSEKTDNRFLRVKLTGDSANVDAIGAKVTLIAANKTFVREQLPVRGFQSCIDPVLHFGLGYVNAVDSVIIQWPGGEKELMTNVGTNQLLAIKKGAGKIFNPGKKGYTPLFQLQRRKLLYHHSENAYNDFRTQPLLARMYSTQGPALAIADVNGDGLVDVYAGGAKGQSGELHLQGRNGDYQIKLQSAFEQDKESEDVDAEFFDIDSDGDTDLFVTSGGYEFSSTEKTLQDRLYVNDGKGNFKRKALPEYLGSTACVRPVDIDNDQDIDVFVGGRISPGRYPETPESYLLVNNGKGDFKFGEIPPALKYAGMVTDAVWTDLNDDNQQDLILAGEWMPIRVFMNNRGELIEETSKFLKEKKTEGLWNCILAEDFDSDGDADFILSNLGLNTQMKVNDRQPARIYYSDLDDNGSIDPILAYHVMDRSYPYPSRDELLEQVPMLKKRFVTYGAYANATIENVLTNEEMSSAKQLQACRLASMYLRNDGDSLVLKELPVEFQFAPVFAMASFDVNKDGHPDVVTGGNLSATRARTGKQTGNTGFVFVNDGKGNFRFVHPTETGLRLTGDVRKIKTFDDYLVIGVNNSALEIYKLKDDVGAQKNN